MSILDDIKSAERQAADIRRDALQRARDAARELDAAGAASAARAVEEAESAASGKLRAASVKAEEKAEAFIRESAARDEKLIAEAEKKLGEAIDYIVKSAGDVK